MKETKAKLMDHPFFSPEQGRDLQPIFAMSAVFTGGTTVQLGVLYIRYGSSP